MPDIPELKGIGQFITMRREAFGGLVWVRKSNAVFQVDEQAFMVLNDLDNGASLKHAAKSARVTEQSVRALLSTLAAPVSTTRTRV